MRHSCLPWALFPFKVLLLPPLPEFALNRSSALFGKSISRWQASWLSASAFPSLRVVAVRAAVSLLEFLASSRPSAEAVTADVALLAKSVRRHQL